jgi:hypothetical protein
MDVMTLEEFRAMRVVLDGVTRRLRSAVKTLQYAENAYKEAEKHVDEMKRAYEGSEPELERSEESPCARFVLWLSCVAAIALLLAGLYGSHKVNNRA